MSVTTLGKLRQQASCVRERASSAKRGYDAAWQRLREQVLRASPLCVDCLTQGRYEAAKEVHHVRKISRAPERRLDAGNLMSLCSACHARRTRKGE